MTMLGDHRPIKSIRLKNLLSFGPDSVAVELESLNVLIGPNASGKSNFIEALGLLQALPSDLMRPIRKGGGINEWLWKGSPDLPEAEIDLVVDYPQGPMDLRYKLAFTESGQRFELVDEAVEDERVTDDRARDVYFYYRYLNGNPVVSLQSLEGGKTQRRLQKEDLVPDQSIISQRKDPDQYPEITWLGRFFSQIKLYREWNFGRTTPARQPQSTDLPEDYLLEDAGNLGLVLNNLRNNTAVRKSLLGRLTKVYETVEDIDTKIQGGTVQVFVHEKDLSRPVPAARLSDGTIRYLCLLTVLCHPTPPPLVCLEEPELGLHPDLLPDLAEMLIEASTRTQLIVTTHSDVLVSALSEVPQAVLVCERGVGGTEFSRLNREQLADWLKKYSLGELWMMGELGGTRW